MNPVAANGPWIVAQIARVRALEREVGDLFRHGAPRDFLHTRFSELKSQVALLELALD